MVQVKDTTVVITLSPHECGTCGVVYGLSEHYEKARQKDHTGWVCPNGHNWYFPQESDEERLKRELKHARDLAARTAAERDQIAASRRAWKGQATKARNRALAGDCPVCGQHVYQLDRHMKRQHADEPLDHPEP